MTTYTGRSPIEVAEDELLFAATKHFNVSRMDALFTCTQRCELGRMTRVTAERLLAQWEGTTEQCREASQLGAIKAFAIGRGI